MPSRYGLKTKVFNLNIQMELEAQGSMATSRGRQRPGPGPIHYPSRLRVRLAVQSARRCKVRYCSGHAGAGPSGQRRLRGQDLGLTENNRYRHLQSFVVEHCDQADKALLK